MIFATRVLWRIEYHCEAKPNNITARRAISLFAKQRISLIKMQKRESFTELYFRITLSSVFIASFAFVKQIHRAMPIPLLKFSDKDYTHFVRTSFRTPCPARYSVLHLFCVLSGGKYLSVMPCFARRDIFALQKWYCSLQSQWYSIRLCNFKRA